MSAEYMCPSCERKRVFKSRGQKMLWCCNYCGWYVEKGDKSFDRQELTRFLRLNPALKKEEK